VDEAIMGEANKSQSSCKQMEQEFIATKKHNRNISKFQKNMTTLKTITCCYKLLLARFCSKLMGVGMGARAGKGRF